MSQKQLLPGMEEVEVRKFRRTGGEALSKHPPFISAEEVWVPAILLYYVDNHPAVEYTDGSFELLHSKKEIRPRQPNGADKCSNLPSQSPFSGA